RSRPPRLVARAASATAGGPAGLSPDVVLLRYLDVCLVLATAPFVLIAGLPLFGYLVAAVAWVLTRLGTVFVQERALRVGSMMGRIWIVVLAILLARFVGGKDDGIMAAALLLAAFTVYFVMSFFTRNPLAGPRTPKPPAHGSPSAS